MSVLKDFRQALRALAQRPAWTAVAAFSLALGIGANTTIFTLVKAIYLKPLPVAEPAELMAVFTRDEKLPDRHDLSVSYPNAVDLAEESRTLAGVALTTFSAFYLSLEGEPVRALGEFVSGNYFEIVGVEAALGRTFTEEDSPAPGSGQPVVVLSHGYWQRRFGGDPGVVGSVVDLNHEPYTVIGVMPQGFTGDQTRLEPNLWLPLALLERVVPEYSPDNDAFESRRGLLFFAFARLAPGVSRDEAQAELRLISRRLAEEYPDANRGRGFELVPLAEAGLSPDPEERARMRLAMGLLMGLVGLVLAVACANVANLLLARMTARAKEVAIRLSLGSTRYQLVRRYLAESLALAFLGGLLGLAVAGAGRQLLLTWWPPRRIVALGYDLSLDGRVLAFTFAVTLAAGLVFGLVPALKASRADVAGELKDSPAFGGGGRLFSGGNLLVAGQVALSAVALVASGLFVRSLDATRDVDPLFDAEKLAVLSIDVGPEGYSREQAEVFFRQLAERAAHLPGAESAVVAELVPFASGGFMRTVYLEGEEEGSGSRMVLCGAVTPGYFETLGIPLLAGRAITDTDTAESRRVVVVNQTMAERVWPGQDPLGQRFHFHGQEKDPVVVGVVADSLVYSLRQQVVPLAYYPLAQYWSSAVSLVVRTAGDPSTALPGLRQLVKELDPDLPYRNLRTLPEAIEDTLFRPRTVARMVGAFGTVALTLSLLGLFSVVSYSVARRQREIGIRMALGARRGDVLRRVLVQGLTLVGGGLAVGLLVSWAGGRLVERFLYGIRPTDLVTFGVTALVLVLAAAVAVLVPARRAATVDPVVALKYE